MKTFTIRTSFFLFSGLCKYFCKMYKWLNFWGIPQKVNSTYMEFITKVWLFVALSFVLSLFCKFINFSYMNMQWFNLEQNIFLHSSKEVLICRYSKIILRSFIPCGWLNLFYKLQSKKLYICYRYLNSNLFK